MSAQDLKQRGINVSPLVVAHNPPQTIKTRKQQPANSSSRTITASSVADALSFQWAYVTVLRVRGVPDVVTARARVCGYLFVVPSREFMLFKPRPHSDPELKNNFCTQTQTFTELCVRQKEINYTGHNRTCKVIT